MTITTLDTTTVTTTSFETKVMLMSDLHLLSANCDKRAIIRDLELARANDARILLNGDIFDFILPGDTKRFSIAAVRDIGMRNDLINAAVDEAVALLRPYGDLIDVIGMGNHETHVEKRHSVDAVALLVARLQALGSSAEHGDICGWYKLRFKLPPRNFWNFTLYRHHGAGGASPTTKGIGDFSRMLCHLDGSVDVVWIGHKHNRFVDTMERHGLNNAGKPYTKSVLCIMTGSYLNLHPIQSHEDIMTRGRRSNYAAEVNMQPQTKGGILLTLRSQPDYSFSIEAHLRL